MTTQQTVGKFTVVYYSSAPDPVAFLRTLADAPVIPGQGRGGISMIEAEGQKLVARKYIHGGLFRILTGDLFLKRRRATAEADIMNYLGNAGFPVVKPFSVVTERRSFAWRLHLVTILEEGAVDLLRQFPSLSQRRRLRIVTQLAESLWRLQQAGVYHPDLHLRNVLVATDGRLVFLDFDRALRKTIGRKEMKSMFLRLGRFVDKMERQGRFSVSVLEKALFLRSYARLSGEDLTHELAESARRASFRHRIGWFIESLLYGDR
jgi:tRNA A-37 threonylcarbamoyl transferase component Bud32